MKTAVYVEDGVEQVVLTAETPFESRALNSLAKAGEKLGDGPLSIKQGQFYECQGGWVRQDTLPVQAQFKPPRKDSLMLVLHMKETENG